MRYAVAALSIVACAEPTIPSSPALTAPLPSQESLAYDATSTRLFVRTRPEATGLDQVSMPNRSASFLRPNDRPEPILRMPAADWNMEVGNGLTSAGVDGASAKLQLSFRTHSCNDVVVVPVDQAGGTNVYAFDQLYDECPSSPPSAGPGLVGKCSPAGHCPHVLWTGSIPAAPTFDSVSVDLNGNAYLPSSNGVVYRFAYGTGTQSVFYDAASDAGGVGLSFVASFPWVDYATGNIILVASRPQGTRVIVVSPSGARLAYRDIPGELAQTGPIFFRGYAYAFTYVTSGNGHACGASPAPTSGTIRLHRMAFSGTDLVDQVMADATICGHPLGVNGAPVEVVSSPVVDVTHPSAPILFLGVRESLIGVYAPADPSQTVVQVSPIGTGPSPDPNSAPCFSSPMVGGTGIVMIGHYQSIWGATYLPPDPLLGQNFVLDPAVPTATSAIDPTHHKLRPNSYPASSPMYLITSDGGRVFFGDGFDGAQSIFRRMDLSLATDRTLSMTFASTFPDLSLSSMQVAATPYIESDSPVIADYDGGNVYFGTSVSYTRGGLRRRTSFIHQATASGLQ